MIEWMERMIDVCKSEIKGNQGLNWKTFLNIALFMVLSISVFSACSLITDPDDDKKDKLNVKFLNDSDSQYTITTIELQDMGVAGETSEPSGTWGSNILNSGERIAPGDSVYFNLDIPQSHWSAYRLGVDRGDGTEVMLDEQPEYVPWTNPSITHWGSDDRTVSVHIRYDQYSGLIVIGSWSDFAGIED